jgi:hypothetical protein
MTLDMFGRTDATAVNDNATIEFAAEQLGHTGTKITVMHYVQRDELVQPSRSSTVLSLKEEDQGTGNVDARRQEPRDHGLDRCVVCR